MAAIYKPTEAIALLRPSFLLPRIQPISSRKTHLARTPFSTSRNAQATHSSTPNTPTPGPQRKSITLTGDTGQVRWSDLSPAEKAVRSTQQSVNFVVVAVGIVGVLGVSYVLYYDVFSPSSKTAFFNRAVTQIREHPACQQLLGPGDKISAHGEHSWSRNARNRYLSSEQETDRWGTEHMRFRFYVEGPLGQGVVHCHLVKRPSQSEFEWQELSVDVKGQRRVELVQGEGKDSKIAPKIFGARWW